MRQRLTVEYLVLATILSLRHLPQIKRGAKEIAMKMTSIILAALLAAASLGVSAHSGGTDDRGCHRDHKTGDYHCH